MQGIENSRLKKKKEAPFKLIAEPPGIIGPLSSHRCKIPHLNRHA